MSEFHSHSPIASEKVLVDRKVFFLDLKENERGRFLKVTEQVNGRRNTILLPALGFKDLVSALERLIAFDAELEGPGAAQVPLDPPPPPSKDDHS